MDFTVFNYSCGMIVIGVYRIGLYKIGMIVNYHILKLNYYRGWKIHVIGFSIYDNITIINYCNIIIESKTIDKRLLLLNCTYFIAFYI